MCVLNELDLLPPGGDVTDGVLKLRTRGVYAKRVIRNKLIERKEYIARSGDNVPEIPAWN
jgi:xylulose-5-phosphate/fructose-6-phosphate phosphoketolase